MVDVADQSDIDFGLSGKLSCHASSSRSAITLSGSLRCFLAFCAEDGGERFLSRFNHSEVDLTGVLGDGVASEVSALSRRLACSGIASCRRLSSCERRLHPCILWIGDENGLAVAALEVSAHGVPVLSDPPVISSL